MELSSGEALPFEVLGEILERCYFLTCAFFAVSSKALYAKYRSRIKPAIDLVILSSVVAAEVVEEPTLELHRASPSIAFP